jgi:antitoxin (DNA-binding transcriptional repressor) of toxin-antitoxin stability system
MKAVTIAEFKRNIPLLLSEVANGASIVIQRGRSRENVAILAPFSRARDTARRLGFLADRGKPVFKDWNMSEESFLASR